ncbi:MAG: hypothetical protein JKX75_05630 [Gammaproteobacteria bacterium]|nr:hypothetical protein [Gammaproteobacteria bacterium]
MYAVDAIVRRAKSLQKTLDAQSICVRLNRVEAGRLGVSKASTVTVKQGDTSTVMNLIIDETVPNASAWIPMAVEGHALLGTAFAKISVEANV